jgi:outer membrane protein OmpA-like peptidoglycan-associated protein
MLYNQVQRSGQKGALVENIDAALKDEHTFNELIAKGNKMLSQVFPAFKSPLISMVSTYAETPKSAAVAYSGFLSALLVDIIDRKILNENLNTEQLTVYLQQHHQPLLSDSPDGLLEVMIPALGLQELRNVKFATPRKNAIREEEEGVEIPAAMDPSTDYDDLARRRGVSAPTILGLAVAIIGITAFAWWYFNIRQNNVLETDAEIAMEVSIYVADSAAVDSLAIAGNSVVEGEYTSFGDGLISYINDAASENERILPMTGVEFINGTTTVDPSSKLVIDELYEVLRGNLRLQIRLLGYDVSGNKDLANKRAYAIKRELLDRGGDNNRIDAGGTSAAGKNAVSVLVISK